MGSKAYHRHFGPILSGATPMSGMQIYAYDPGTTDAKTIWSDYNKSATASNPIDADAYGIVNFYGDGLYDILIVDENSNTIHDLPNVLFGPLQQPVPVSVNKNGTDQTSVVNSTWTKVTWSSEDFDEGATFSSNQWIPGRTGQAFIFGHLTLSAIGSAGVLEAAVYVNSVIATRMRAVADLTTSGIYGVPFGAIVDVGSTSDFVEIYVRQTGGEDATILGGADQTYFMGALLA